MAREPVMGVSTMEELRSGVTGMEATEGCTDIRRRFLTRICLLGRGVGISGVLCSTEGLDLIRILSSAVMLASMDWVTRGA